MARAGEPPKGDIQGDRSGLLSGYVSRQDLALEFDVSERTIDRWVDDGLLPAPIKLGRKRLFHLQTLEKHLLERSSRRSSRGRRR